MPNKCALCGLYPAAMTAVFSNGNKTCKVDESNIHEWKVVFRTELHMNDRICRKHFSDDGHPLPKSVSGVVDEHGVVRKSRRGRKFRYGTHRRSFKPTDTEVALAEQVAHLHDKVNQLSSQLLNNAQQLDTIKGNVRKILFSNGCQRILIDHEVYNLLREKYLFRRDEPVAFNIHAYQERDASIRLFTSAPSYASLNAVAVYMNNHYKKLFSSTREPSLDTINALAAMLLKARTNLPYEFIAVLFLMSASWITTIIHHMLERLCRFVEPILFSPPHS